MILLYCQVISVCYHLTINIKQELYGVTKTNFYSPAILTSSSRGGWSRVIDCHLSCDRCVANAYGAS